MRLWKNGIVEQKRIESKIRTKEQYEHNKSGSENEYVWLELKPFFSARGKESPDLETNFRLVVSST